MKYISWLIRDLLFVKNWVYPFETVNHSITIDLPTIVYCSQSPSPRNVCPTRHPKDVMLSWSRAVPLGILPCKVPRSHLSRLTGNTWGAVLANLDASPKGLDHDSHCGKRQPFPRWKHRGAPESLENHRKPEKPETERHLWIPKLRVHGGARFILKVEIHS